MKLWEIASPIQKTVTIASAYKKGLKKHGTAELMKTVNKVVNTLIAGEFPTFGNNHKLTGKFKGYYDIHVSNRIVMIYRLEGDTITLANLGTHKEVGIGR